MITNFQPTEYSPLQLRLLNAVEQYPQDWKLTPLKEDKRPYRKNWQIEPPLSRAAITQEIISGQAKGIGLRTGLISGGILAVDFDGSSSVPLFVEKFGEIPLTQGFSSLRVANTHLPERFQLVFDVPQDFWHAMKNRLVFKTGVEGEQLELRWAGSQSVLPGSVHPRTGCYHWLPGRSPAECPSRALAPDSLIEALLVDPVEQTQPKIPYQPQQQERWTEVDWALSYLAALSPARADNYDDWLAVGMALRSASESLLSDWDNWSRQSAKYKPGECDRKWKSFKHSGVGIGTLAHMAKQDGWRSPFSKNDEGMSKNRSVTGDSHLSGDSCNPEPVSISATVTSVTEVLRLGFPDFEEQARLDEIQLKSSMSKSSFWKLVASLRTQLDEVQPSDEIRLSKLIDWSNASLDFVKALPSMAKDILHDAKVLNIDPIGIWQYLLPAVLSLVGKKINLDIKSHKIPAIAWTGLVAESGAGKTRAESLVTAPLKTLQANEWQRFQEDLAKYEQQKEAKGKKGSNDSGSGEPIEKPVAERKYLFEVATIQAVMKRLNEQGLNGSLWSRDELAGLFKSFGQFSNSEQEGLECFLKLWDGSSTQVDRVRYEDSHFTKESRLSVAGGIQPGVFQQVFKDRNDSQGIQARFLFAITQPLAPKRTNGYCILSEKLPALYAWLDNLSVGDIKLSKEADALYTRLYEEIGNQAMHTSMPAIRAWMMKLSTNMLRIALGLHLIECYHGTAQMSEISVATLERAVLFAQYYRSSFQVLQEKTVESDEISSILLRIWDYAAQRHPDGISSRDAYREIKSIQFRARDASRPVGAYTSDLFAKLEQMGKGRVVKQGRSVKFIAELNPPTVGGAQEEKKYTPPLVTVVTVPETTTPQGLEVSLVNEVSLVTLEKNIKPNNPPDSQPSDLISEEGESLEIKEEAIAPPPEPEATDLIPQQINDQATSPPKLEQGGAVGFRARVLDIRRQKSIQVHFIEQWDDRNGFYRLSDGETYYPAQIALEGD